MNLCTNATAAMAQQQGVLTVKLREVTLKDTDLQDDPTIHPGPFVEIVVNDTGCGIDRETQQHIFEPFFSTKYTNQLSDLGSAIVQGITRSWCLSIV